MSLDKSNVVAIIPARSGSKRLPNKNLMQLCGKPLIGWTIEAAKKASIIENIIVSTDSANIKEVALRFGAEVPFDRPKELATDTSSTDDVLLHAISELGLKSNDIIVLLQPTSPLRGADDILAAVSLLEDDNIQGVVSVCECEHSPLWSNTLPSNMLMGGFIDDDISSKRSQDLLTYYRLNGAIFAYRVKYLLECKGRKYSNCIRAFEMQVVNSVDIDSKLDFDFAEYLLSKIEQGK
ncbi:cytidylyltransferase domain-containing protein [Vibrio astriarenae]